MGKKLNPTASTDALLRQGEEQVIRLRTLAECAPLAAPVAAVTGALRAARDRRLAREEALIPLRVKCSFADFGWDQALRATAKTAEAQTGSTKSPAYREIFPDGFGELVEPAGEPQRGTAAQFLVHLATCSAPGAEAIREACRPRLQQAHDALVAALDERKAAEDALSLARIEEQAARRDFFRTIDQTIAQVRATFPEDRARQELAFPSVPRTGRAEDRVEEAAPASESDGA